MFKRLLKTDLNRTPDDVSPHQPGGLNALRIAYDDWRFGNDVAAIVAALDRLSNRRLHLIGLRRESLFDTVGEMMLRAKEDRAIGQEVIALLETSADKAIGFDEFTTSEADIQDAETSPKKRYK